MGNMEPRRLQRGEEMGEKRAGIQEVPILPFAPPWVPRELPFICTVHDLLKTMLTRPAPRSPSDEGQYQERDVHRSLGALCTPRHPSLLLWSQCHQTPDRFLQPWAKSSMPRGLLALLDQEGPGWEQQGL